MAFRVYIAHSVAPHELGAIYAMAELAARKGMDPIIPDRQWSFDLLPARIQQLLKGLDAFVAVATFEGTHLPWLNAELSAALNLGMDTRRIVSVVDHGLDTPPVGQKVIIDRANFDTTITNTLALLEQLQIDRTQKNLLAGLVLGGLMALLLASRE